MTIPVMYRIGVVAIWGAAIYLLFFYSFPWGDFYDWDLSEAWDHARYRGNLFWYLPPYQWPGLPPWQVILEWVFPMLIILGAPMAHGLLKVLFLGTEYPNSSESALSTWRRLLPNRKASFPWEMWIFISPIGAVFALGCLTIVYWVGPLVVVIITKLFLEIMELLF